MGKLFWYRNTGTVDTPTFSGTPTKEMEMSSIESGVTRMQFKPLLTDLDGDGRVDLVLGAVSETQVPQGLFWYRNVGPKNLVANDGNNMEWFMKSGVSNFRLQEFDNDPFQGRAPTPTQTSPPTPTQIPTPTQTQTQTPTQTRP